MTVKAPRETGRSGISWRLRSPCRGFSAAGWCHNTLRISFLRLNTGKVGSVAGRSVVVKLNNPD